MPVPASPPTTTRAIWADTTKVYEAPYVRDRRGRRHADRDAAARRTRLLLRCRRRADVMEEHLGKRVNHERVDEALTLDATTIATGCPFCR